MSRYLTRTVRVLLLAVGMTSLALGLLGVVLPVLPTTPFLLVAAWCFLRSSERLHRRLLEHPFLGRRLSDYMEGRGLPLRTKASAVSALWIGISVSAVLFVPWLLADIALLVVAVAVTVHLLRIPTLPS